MAMRKERGQRSLRENITSLLNSVIACAHARGVGLPDRREDRGKAMR
jgi:hypothetical protein